MFPGHRTIYHPNWPRHCIRATKFGIQRPGHQQSNQSWFRQGSTLPHCHHCDTRLACCFCSRRRRGIFRWGPLSSVADLGALRSRSLHTDHVPIVPSGSSSPHRLCYGTGTTADLMTAMTAAAERRAKQVSSGGTESTSATTKSKYPPVKIQGTLWTVPEDELEELSQAVAALEETPAPEFDERLPRLQLLPFIRQCLSTQHRNFSLVRSSLVHPTRLRLWRLIHTFTLLFRYLLFTPSCSPSSV